MREALKQLGWKDQRYEMIPDLNVMKDRGLEWTPALEIDGRIIYQGENPTVAAMKELLVREKEISAQIKSSQRKKQED